MSDRGKSKGEETGHGNWERCSRKEQRSFQCWWLDVYKVFSKNDWLDQYFNNWLFFTGVQMSIGLEDQLVMSVMPPDLER